MEERATSVRAPLGDRDILMMMRVSYIANLCISNQVIQVLMIMIIGFFYMHVTFAVQLN